MVVGLGAVREQVGAVDDLQPGNGLIIAVHEVQQQQLLPRGHAVGRGAGDAFEIGADGDRLTAPDGSVLPRPDLRFRYGGDGLRVLRRRGRVAGAGNRAAGGCGQSHGQQEHQQDQAFQECVPLSVKCHLLTGKPCRMMALYQKKLRSATRSGAGGVFILRIPRPWSHAERVP